MECLRERKHELEKEDIYITFGIILHALHDAHKENDAEQIQNIYAFAEWCHKQKSKDVWNAAGVVFYEHLGRYAEIRDALPKWISHPFYKEIRELLKRGLDEKQLQKIDKVYQDGI